MIIGAVIVLFFMLVGIFAPQIATHDPIDVVIARRHLPPGSVSSTMVDGEVVYSTHHFGTDDLGRDMFSRVVYGARVSIIVGVSAVAIGAFVGMIFGILSGYFGGVLDTLVMRLMDIMLAFPGMLLGLVIVTILGASMHGIIITIAILNVPTFARIVRGSTLGVRKLEYIDAIRAVGANDGRIIFVHILPNIISPIIVQATLAIGSAIVIAAALSFLGIGIPAPTPEWGSLVDRGRGHLHVAQHMILYPGIAIFLFVVGINIFGDGLRDYLEPKKHR